MRSNAKIKGNKNEEQRKKKRCVENKRKQTYSSKELNTFSAWCKFRIFWYTSDPSKNQLVRKPRRSFVCRFGFYFFFSLSLSKLLSVKSSNFLVRMIFQQFWVGIRHNEGAQVDNRHRNTPALNDIGNGFNGVGQSIFFRISNANNTQLQLFGKCLRFRNSLVSTFKR